jgi:hypothetical protein
MVRRRDGQRIVVFACRVCERTFLDPEGRLPRLRRNRLAGRRCPSCGRLARRFGRHHRLKFVKAFYCQGCHHVFYDRFVRRKPMSRTGNPGSWAETEAVSIVRGFERGHLSTCDLAGLLAPVDAAELIGAGVDPRLAEQAVAHRRKITDRVRAMLARRANGHGAALARFLGHSAVQNEPART